MYQNGNADISELELERSQNPLFKHVAKTYGWMFLGLLITFATSFMLVQSGMVFVLYSVPMLSIILLVAQVGLVVYLSSRITKFSVATAQWIFIGYALLTGVVFASIFVLYDIYSIALVFGVTALFFGVMAAAGIITKRDVSRFAPIVLVGLVTLIVLGLVSMFLNLPGLDVAVCFLGVIIFLGVTTYDAKKNKDLFYAYQNDQAMLDKVAIYSALQLYLDFINLFLYLIRLLGKRK